MSNTWSRLARFYDWEHATFVDDVVMYLEFARRTGGPVLELASGTGRLMRPLLKAGIAVVGVDASTEMIEIARRELEREGLLSAAKLVHSDIRDLTLAERFRMAFVGLDSFGLLLSREAQIQALGRIYEHLVPGGLLILDLANGNLRGGEPREELLLQHMGVDPETGRNLTKWTARRTDPAGQVDLLTYVYDELQEDNSVKRWTSDLSLRYFGRFELELLLERSGYVIECLYGSYDLAPYDSTSERLIAVAVNPENR